MYRNELKGNKNYFKLGEGSSYRGFELLRENNSKCKKEIQGKSPLVRLSVASSYRESTVSLLIDHSMHFYTTIVNSVWSTPRL